MAVHLHKNFLLTAGMDKLVRCFDVKVPSFLLEFELN